MRTNQQIYHLSVRKHFLMAHIRTRPYLQRGAHVFSRGPGPAALIDRTADFRLEGEYPLLFTRSYRNQDNISLLSVSALPNSLDIFLVGQMSVYVDLIDESGDGFISCTSAQARPARRHLCSECAVASTPETLDGHAAGQVKALLFLTAPQPSATTSPSSRVYTDPAGIDLR